MSRLAWAVPTAFILAAGLGAALAILGVDVPGPKLGLLGLLGFAVFCGVLDELIE